MLKRDKTFSWRPGAAAGLNVAVVGGTGGIGRAISRSLAGQGAHVLVVGRTQRDPGVPGIDFLRADLSLMSEAARVAAALPAESLDLLVLTTGIIAAPAREETAEGIERDLAVSYLSRMVILQALGTRLRGRVFVMGFPGNEQLGDPGDLNAERSYKAMAQHMNTVAANEALVLDAARRYPQLEVFGLNPGFVKSDIRGNLFGPGSLRHRLFEAALTPVTTSAETYARRITPLLSSADLRGRSGMMFDRKGVAIRPSAGLTPERVDAFMTASAKLATPASR